MSLVSMTRTISMLTWIQPSYNVRVGGKLAHVMR